MEEEREMTPEEMQQLRQEVAKELEAEERGESLPRLESGSQEKKDDEQEDPWAGVSPTLKAMFDNMQAKVAALDETQARLKQAESRIGYITNEFSAAKKAAESMAAAPTKEQMEDAAKSDEGWEELKSEFPEWADATDKRMNAKIASLRKELSGSTNAAVVQQEIAQIKASLKNVAPVEIQKSIVSYFHPDWEATIGTQEYNEWLAKQPSELKDKIKSDKAVDAVAVLNAFQESRSGVKSAEEIAEERKRRIKIAVNPQGKKSLPIKSESDMTEAELRAKIGAEVFAS